MAKRNPRMTKEELQEQIDSGIDITQIADFFNCKVPTIRRYMRIYRLQPNEYRYRQIVELVKQHASEMTLREFVTKFAPDCDKRTLYVYARRLGVKFMPDSSGKHKVEIDLDITKKMIGSGYNTQQIGQRFGVSPELVKLRLREAGTSYSEIRQESLNQYPGADLEKVASGHARKCTNTNSYSCKYSSEGYCVYCLIEHHRRPCPPWACTEYVKMDKKQKKKFLMDEYF